MGGQNLNSEGLKTMHFSACFLVGMDVAMVRVKGTNDDRDEFDK